MNVLIKYSGLFVVVLSWTFIVLPYYLLRKNHNMKVLSDVGAIPKVGNVLNIGLILIAVSQLMFWRHLVGMLEMSAFTFSILLLNFASANLLLAGIINRGMNKKLHNNLTRIYFAFSSVGSFFLSFNFSTISMRVAALEVGLIVILGVGMVYLLVKQKNLFAEIWAILMSSIWMILIYLFIL
jgi:hypothetical protein